MKKIFGYCFALQLLAASANAQTIAQWTFETLGSFGGSSGHWATNISSEVGGGTASIFHQVNGAGWVRSTGNGSPGSLSSSNWAVGDFYQFALSTAGFTNIGLSFDLASASGGPARSVLEYSTDGSSFSTYGPTNTLFAIGFPNPTWSSTTYNSIYTFNYDLTSVSQLNDASVVYFRLLDTSTTSAGGGTVNGGGSERVDNFTVTVVPEPQGMLMLGLLALFRPGRRRRA